MKRKRRRRFPNKRKRKILKIYFILAAAMMILTGMYLAAEVMLGPVLEDVAEVRVKELAAESINDSIIQLMEEMPEGQFLNFETDEEGYISMVSANTTYMNEFSSEIIKLIHENLGSIEGERVRVPVGAVLESDVLSQIGPYMELKIEPIGNVSIDFSTEFISEGINQTKYKVFMEVEGAVRPVIPFVDEEYEVSTVIPVAETVIVGKVPQTYLSLPLTEY
ncbi:MAG: sporulation protein YunB [Clostridiales bacterium]|nr:sporulation protein YunB [Clostridiales bacterium]